MRVRKMRSGELSQVRAVYEARARISVGLIHRDSKSWREAGRRRKPKRLWLIAEDRGRIVGYAVGKYGDGRAFLQEVVWHPSYDGTSLGLRLLGEMLRRLRLRRQAYTISSEHPGSPILPLLRQTELVGFESPGVFLAAVTDVRALLRDAKRVLNRRLKGRMRLRVGERATVVGQGSHVAVTVTMEPNVLLGLLLGLRSLKEELKVGSVKYRPRTRRVVSILETVFPEREFWILDVW